MAIKHEEQKTSAGLAPVKRPYRAPKLTVFGAVKTLTLAGATGSAEGSGSANPFMATSDRRAKENIVRIGDHPLGMGLYLFDYRPEFREQWGAGRQFGLMADEVEQVLPEAVSVNPDGYKQVNYAMLGITRRLH
jgi:hypothetical protein